MVRLTPLLGRSVGRPEVVIGLIDGPVVTGHPGFAGATIRDASGGSGSCSVGSAAACFHGTFVAGVLSASRASGAPALCPGCTLVVRPIFHEANDLSRGLPIATPRDLVSALTECMDAGARIVNLSAALVHGSAADDRAVEAVVNEASRRGVLLVVAAGNQALMGGSALTRHPWVIPVVSYSLAGRLRPESNLGAAIGRRGLGAPGEGVVSLSAAGGLATSGGTSVAAPFVTGTAALLWSAFPRAAAATVRWALTEHAARRPRSVVPPLLDAWAAYRALSTTWQRR
jgi:subtilisin family serine protease